MLRYKFNSHQWHNPDCDITEVQIDRHSFLTYGVYVSGPKAGQEFMEYYRGENYVAESKRRSYSRVWKEAMPETWLPLWFKARQVYREQWMGLDLKKGVEYLYYDTTDEAKNKHQSNETKTDVL